MAAASALTNTLWLLISKRLLLLQGKRVLLAEDNLINQTVAKKMLTQLGMVSTSSGKRSPAEHHHEPHVHKSQPHLGDPSLQQSVTV